MTNIVEINENINIFTTQYTYPYNNENIKNELKKLKTYYVKNDDEHAAEKIWCYEEVIYYYEKYYEMFKKLKDHEYYKAWCILELIEISYNRLFENGKEYLSFDKIDFIYKKVLDLQSLFPYKIFASTEFIEKEVLCSICNKKIDIRNPCGHEIGKIYNGEYCHRIITELDFVGTALVHHPTHKYAVPFAIDPNTNNKIDNYDYRVVEYLINNIISPFDDWEIEKTYRRHPHKYFKNISRNDKCPCESGKKYKQCCLNNKEGVLRPHIEFKFKNRPFEEEYIKHQVEYLY